jgi:thiosulfate reductase cytochrome b subunit
MAGIDFKLNLDDIIISSFCKSGKEWVQFDGMVRYPKFSIFYKAVLILTRAMIFPVRLLCVMDQHLPHLVLIIGGFQALDMNKAVVILKWMGYYLANYVQYHNRRIRKGFFQDHTIYNGR